MKVSLETLKALKEAGDIGAENALIMWQNLSRQQKKNVVLECHTFNNYKNFIFRFVHKQNF